MENDSRELFLMQIDSSANYRRKRAEKYPTDTRNLESAEELQKLYAFVEKLPENHSLFRRWSAMNGDESEMFAYRLSRYGFDGGEDPEEFILKEVSLKINKFNQN